MAQQELAGFIVTWELGEGEAEQGEGDIAM
jgi:hypothetical protein